MTTATGGSMRCVMSQNAMSAFPTERRMRRLTAPARIRKIAAPDAERGDDEHVRDDADEEPDEPDGRAVAEAHEGIRCGRAEKEREHRAGEPHEDGVAEGLERVVADRE